MRLPDVPHDPSFAERSKADPTLAAFAISLRDHLEQAPLLKKLHHVFDLHQPLENVLDALPRSISLRCRCVKAVTTWNLQPAVRPKDSEEPVRFCSISLRYVCADCRTETSDYWLMLVPKWASARVGPRTLTNNMDVTRSQVMAIKDVTIRKVGQWPEWEQAISKRVEKALGQYDASLYRKGVACYREGFGIGAAAYFRRVIEDQTEAILALVRQLAEASGDIESLERLDAARKSERASERLKVAAEKIPPGLRVGGSNPLAILYGVLSGPLDLPPENWTV